PRPSRCFGYGHILVDDRLAQMTPVPAVAEQEIDVDVIVVVAVAAGAEDGVELVARADEHGLEEGALAGLAPPPARAPGDPLPAGKPKASDIQGIAESVL